MHADSPERLILSQSDSALVLVKAISKMRQDQEEEMLNLCLDHLQYHMRRAVAGDREARK